VKRRRILVVDDHVVAAQSLGELLTQMGYDVQVAHDGRAALEATRLYRPQVVLLDLSMPGVDGYGVVERLRRETGFDGVRFVAVTGSRRPEDLQRSHAAGFDAHLLKPVVPDSLRVLLERL
jgi:CheY-like chemotaxis protein